MRVALGLWLQPGVLRAVALGGSTPRLVTVRVGTHPVDPRVSMTPHRDRCHRPDLVDAAVRHTEVLLRHVLDPIVEAVVDDARAAGELVGIAVVAPKRSAFQWIAQRFSTIRWADRADAQLMTDAVLTSASRADVPVRPITEAVARRGAASAFGVSRGGLDDRTTAAAAAWGSEFAYDHRLPSLAASVFLAR
ncbi:MAG TPA: hypothetical protein VFU93_03105 [Acidimicrobiales bacterium]|nr:hypothetical protein [Acidimicrobiales bacterium]